MPDGLTAEQADWVVIYIVKVCLVHSLCIMSSTSPSPGQRTQAYPGPSRAAGSAPARHPPGAARLFRVRHRAVARARRLRRAALPPGRPSWDSERACFRPGCRLRVRGICGDLPRIGRRSVPWPGCARGCLPCAGRAVCSAGLASGANPKP